MRLWNERETLHKQLVAHRAAVQLLIPQGEKVTKIRQHLQVVTREAAQVCQENDEPTTATLTDFGAFMLDGAVLAEKMSQNSQNSRLLAEWLAAAQPTSVITVTTKLCSDGTAIVCVSPPPMTTASLWNRCAVAISVLTSILSL